jgi:hypothetical protein
LYLNILFIQKKIFFDILSWKLIFLNIINFKCCLCLCFIRICYNSAIKSRIGI